jgi:hypothetical protein
MILWLIAALSGNAFKAAVIIRCQPNAARYKAVALLLLQCQQFALIRNRVFVLVLPDAQAAPDRIGGIDLAVLIEIMGAKLCRARAAAAQAAVSSFR